MHRIALLGLDFGGSKIAVAVGAADGTLLDSVTLPVDPNRGAHEIFAGAVSAARSLLASVASDHDLLSVGASTFGIPRSDGVDLAPNVAGWEHLAFDTELRAAFPDAVVSSATDVKAAAQAEWDGGALTGCDPGLYLNLGTGLAAAFVVNGRVVAGRHGAAGEIGYNLRAIGAYSEQRLEEAVSGKVLTALAAELTGRADPATLLGAGEGDPRARRAFDAFLAELCFHLVNLAIALDPERIAVGGGMTRSWERFEPALSAALHAAVPYPPELVRAAYPFDAPLRGALSLARSAVARDRSASVLTTEGAP